MKIPMLFLLVGLMAATIGCNPGPSARVATPGESVETGPEPQSPAGEWRDFKEGRWLVLGSVKMTIDSVSIGKAYGDGLFAGESKDDLLLIRIRLQNTNAKRKIEYEPWCGKIFSTGKTLKDDLGNTYRGVTFFGGVKGQVDGSISLRADEEPTEDLLTFERPVPAARYLFLELDGGNVDEHGAFRWKIPVPKPNGSTTDSTVVESRPKQNPSLKTVDPDKIEPEEPKREDPVRNGLALDKRKMLFAAWYAVPQQAENAVIKEMGHKPRPDDPITYGVKFTRAIEARIKKERAAILADNKITQETIEDILQEGVIYMWPKPAIEPEKDRD